VANHSYMMTFTKLFKASAGGHVTENFVCEAIDFVYTGRRKNS